jgi:hypothetical protein
MSSVFDFLGQSAYPSRLQAFRKDTTLSRYLAGATQPSKHPSVILSAWPARAATIAIIAMASSACAGTSMQGPSSSGYAPVPASMFTKARSSHGRRSTRCVPLPMKTSHLYVANFGGQDPEVLQFSPPYKAPPNQLASESYPRGLAFDDLNNLFVSSSVNFGVLEYAPPYTGKPKIIRPPDSNKPYGLAVDNMRSLFVADNNSSVVFVMPPPYMVPSTEIGFVNQPTGLVLDAGCDLFVANAALNAVLEFAPPYTGSPIATITRSIINPTAVALDASGDLFVTNFNNNTVLEFMPPYTSAPIATISKGVKGPNGVAIDASGDLFVADSSSNAITEYLPPFKGAPVLRITTSVAAPGDLVFGP